MIDMLAAVTVTLIITSALGYSMRAGRNGVRRPYNNRYNDATGARDDRLG